MERAFRTLALLISAVALAAGCSVKDAPAPSPTGPSELSLSLTMAATPDTITQDGSSQALVVVVARDVSGRAVANLPIRFDVTKNGQVVDYGTLSTKTGLTSADGRVQAFYTAPTPPSNSSDVQASVVSVLATPVGTNYASVVPRAVEIRLVPPGQILPPGTGPTAAFTYAWPGSQGAGVPVTFDASGSGSPGGLVSYGWDFGDGTAGSGVTVQHTFTVGGTYTVRLTVTDTKGQTAWVTKQVAVAAGPTALFTWTQTTAGAPVIFNGGASWAIPPAGILSYTWYVGPTLITNGVIPPPYSFGSAGTYSVTLVVTDTNGSVGRQTQSVTVK